MQATLQSSSPRMRFDSVPEFAVGDESSTSISLPAQDLSALSPGKRSGHHHRGSSSSFVMVKQVQETPEQLVDQNVSQNVNAEWVNMKGAWVIHVVLIMLAKMIINEIPGVSDSVKWTMVTMGYMVVTYIIFHLIKGAPFDVSGGAYDDLTLWEQIDQGFQYTPAKKYLTSLPIGLFLLSTHYTHYDPWLFGINLGALLFVLFPKLPILHRSRLLFFPSDMSGTITPNASASAPLAPQTNEKY